MIDIVISMIIGTNLGFWIAIIVICNFLSSGGDNR